VNWPAVVTVDRGWETIAINKNRKALEAALKFIKEGP
jgi:uncharacterized protein YbdZ (MbtH family)